MQFKMHKVWSLDTVMWKKKQTSRQKTVLFGFSTAFIQTDIKWLSAGSYWKYAKIDLPDSKVHALKSYASCLFLIFYQSYTGTQFKESNISTNFVKKNCSP